MRNVLFLSCILACFAEEVLRDGDFETFGDWVISPLSLWCDKFCSNPLQWQKSIQSGEHFIMVPPNTEGKLVQHFNQTKLEELYNTCTLDLYVRVSQLSGVNFDVLWGNSYYTVEWFDALNSVNNEWSKMTLEFNKMSSSLEINIYTSEDGWFAMDNASLNCEEVSWFAQANTLKIALLIVAALLVFAAVRFLYAKHATVKRVLTCGYCCRRHEDERFVQLEELEPHQERSDDD